MILYFADRTMRILGKASTNLESGYLISSDELTEDVESGLTVLDVTIKYNEDEQIDLEKITDAGNYILYSNDRRTGYFTIVDSEIVTSNYEIQIYAEDAGLDLMNEIVGPYEATSAQNIQHYINKFSTDSGFEIRFNEFDTNTKKKLAWDDNVTATDRLLSVAAEFEAELGFSFAIEGMDIIHKYIDIYKKRGKENNAQLRMGYEISDLRIKRSVANLVTALEVNGPSESSFDPVYTRVSSPSGNPKNKGYYIKNKDGNYSKSSDTSVKSGTTYYTKMPPDRAEGEDPKDVNFSYPSQISYNDGSDFYISGTRLYSRKANEKWSRYLYKNEPNQLNNAGYIVGYFEYKDVEDGQTMAQFQNVLKNKAIEELKKLCVKEITYEADIYELPDNISLGDVVNIIDDNGENYVSARLMQIKQSVTNDTITCTFGDFKAKDSGISAKVQALADSFEQIAKVRQLYTWIAYADDEEGNGVSLDPTGKKYIGVATSRFEATPDLVDLSPYTWSLYVGADGEQGPQGPQGEKGEQGETGNGITSTVITYGISDSGTDSAQVTWQLHPDVIPDVPQGKYLWTRTTTTYSNGNLTNTYSVAYKAANGINGQDAKNITTVTTLYVLKDPGVEPTKDDPNWSSIPPSYKMGKKYWRMDYIVFEDESTAKSTPVLDNAMNKAIEAAMAAIVSNVKQYCVASSDEPNECYIYTYSEFTGSSFAPGTLYFEKVDSLLSSGEVEEEPLPYDSTATYAVDALVLRNDRIYKCIEAIEVPEEFNESKWTTVVYYIYVPTADNSKVDGKTYYYVSNKTEPTWYNDSIYNVITNDSKNFFENNYIWSRNKITYGSGRIEYLNLTVEPISNLFTRNITFDAGINELDDRISLTAESISTVSEKFDPIEDRIATIENNAILSVEPGAITGTISEYVATKVGEGINNSGLNEVQEQLRSVTAQLSTDGFTVSKSDQGTSSLIDGEGLKVIKKVDGQDVIVAQFTNDDSEVDYLEVRRFLTFGAHRAETVQMFEWDGSTSTVGTGFFYNGVNNQNGSN